MEEVLTNDNVVKVIIALIGLMGSIITYMIIPYFKSKVTKERREDIYFWAKIAVLAAEQMKEAGIINVPKKKYVLNYLKKKGFDISESDLDMLIESAVYELNLVGKELNR